MTIRVAINGFGRIGRNVLRALYENSYRDRLQVVAINDLGDPSLNAHLLRHDTVHGHFPFKVEHDAESITVDGDRIAISSERDPAKLPWSAMSIDLVMECTGLFTKREAAAKRLPHPVSTSRKARSSRAKRVGSRRLPRCRQQAHSTALLNAAVL